MTQFEIQVVISMAIVALIALGYGYLEHLRREELQTTGERVRGLVVRNNFHLSRTSVSRPVVRFTTNEGRTVEVEYTRGVAFAVPRWPTGEAVWIVYAKGNPHDFFIVS